MSEIMLHPTFKRFLEAAGFRVKGEVGGCDISLSAKANRRSSPSWR
jgi:hypothetical protein